MHRAFWCARHHRNPARDPGNRNARARRPAHHPTNPTRHPFCSAARAFYPASRANHSAPRANGSAIRAFCSTRRAGEPHAPSFLLGPPSKKLGHRGYFPRAPSPPAHPPGKLLGGRGYLAGHWSSEHGSALGSTPETGKHRPQTGLLRGPIGW